MFTGEEDGATWFSARRGELFLHLQWWRGTTGEEGHRKMAMRPKAWTWRHSERYKRGIAGGEAG